MNTQFKKGVLEMCVLMLLKKKDAYGYELAEKISSAIEIAQGTLYPLLRKLKADGYCETYLSDKSGGPPRRYYKLTAKGRRAEQEKRQEWLYFVDSVGSLMEEESNE
ncbi:MAG: PadR family transcriptional regulator [Eubacteriales bacterium]|nr:PadR family transcriptional regulator [Eubacteriales bacterium]